MLNFFSAVMLLNKLFCMIKMAKSSILLTSTVKVLYFDEKVFWQRNKIINFKFIFFISCHLSDLLSIKKESKGSPIYYRT